MHSFICSCIILSLTSYLCHAKTSCGTNTWCYYNDIYPSLISPISQQVSIQNLDDEVDTYFHIYFTPRNRHCLSPSISFEFELIDYDLSSEYLQIFNNDSLTIQQCQGGSQNNCANWRTCLNNKDLGISYITMDTSYKITIFESAAVDALCGHSYSINALLTIHCASGSTRSPTFNPTSTPTINPTLSPTEFPTLEPSQPTTTIPTTSMPITSAPTSTKPSKSPSNIPSRSPSYNTTRTPSTNPIKTTSNFYSTSPAKLATNQPTNYPLSEDLIIMLTVATKLSTTVVKKTTAYEIYTHYNEELSIFTIPSWMIICICVTMFILCIICVVVMRKCKQRKQSRTNKKQLTKIKFNKVNNQTPTVMNEMNTDQNAAVSDSVGEMDIGLHDVNDENMEIVNVSNKTIGNDIQKDIEEEIIDEINEQIELQQYREDVEREKIMDKQQGVMNEDENIPPPPPLPPNDCDNNEYISGHAPPPVSEHPLDQLQHQFLSDEVISGGVHDVNDEDIEIADALNQTIGNDIEKDIEGEIIDAINETVGNDQVLNEIVDDKQIIKNNGDDIINAKQTEYI